MYLKRTIAGGGGFLSYSLRSYGVSQWRLEREKAIEYVRNNNSSSQQSNNDTNAATAALADAHLSTRMEMGEIYAATSSSEMRSSNNPMSR